MFKYLINVSLNFVFDRLKSRHVKIYVKSDFLGENSFDLHVTLVEID